MITLIGHGYIGEAIWNKLQYQSYIPAYWLTHNESIPKDTTIIVNAAGYTGSPNVDACEIHKEDTIAGNVLWPLKLEMENKNTPIIHISSGCVYTGYEKDFTEEDEPNFNFDNGSFYSGSKALEQKLLASYMNKSYLLRIRMPFGSEKHPKNFLTKLQTYAKLIDFRNSLSHVDDVANVVFHFIAKRPKTGIYNLTNGGSKTTREIVEMMGMKKDWFTEAEFFSAVKAPRSNCVLDNNKLKNIFPIRNIDEALKDAIENYK
jgi:UDP-glucose 4,6-dehydratase